MRNSTKRFGPLLLVAGLTLTACAADDPAGTQPAVNSTEPMVDTTVPMVDTTDSMVDTTSTTTG